MKTRLLAIGMAVISATLVACGGGGGGNTTPPTSPSTAPSPTPTPVPTATPNAFGCVGQPLFRESIGARHTMAAPRPIGPGDQFTYTGQLSQTYTQSAPCPQPTSTASATTSTSVSDAPTTAPGGGSASLSTSSETDVYPTRTSTLSTASVLQINAGKLLLYSTNSSDGSGNSIQTSYNTAQEIDDLGTGGAWANVDPSATVTETLADGTSIARTVASDGSYSDTQRYNGTNAYITVAGSATLAPLDGSGVYHYNIGGSCSEGELEFSYGAPSAGNITLTITAWGFTSTGACVESTKTRSFPAWFSPPTGAGYVTDTFADNGTQSFPSSCSSVPPSIGTSGTQVVETYNVLDPVLGYTETRTTTSYDVAGYGPACVTIVDTLKSYYDYSMDTTKLDYQSQNGQPNSVDTINETLTMQSATCGSGSTPCAQVRQTDAQAVSPARIAARIAGIVHYRAVQRARKLQSLRSLASRLSRKGAVR